MKKPIRYFELRNNTTGIIIQTTSKESFNAHLNDMIFQGHIVEVRTYIEGEPKEENPIDELLWQAYYLAE